jgi:hypothetical protein
MYTDVKLFTSLLCDRKATYLLQQEQRDQTAHSITVPINPALQLLDVISITDQSAPAGTDQTTSARIWRQEIHFNAEHATYEQTLFLEGP